MTRSLRSFAMLVAALASAVAYRGLVELAAVAKPPRGVQATEGFLFEPSSSSPWLIYACSVWLIGARLPRLRTVAGTSGGGGLATAMLLVAAALGIWAPYVGDPSLLVPSLSLALLAAAGLVAGLPGMRAMLLPAAFLLLAIPVPASVLNQIAYPAQIWTADVTTAALDFVGLSISSHADLIFYRGRVFQVIESCSGIRSVITMIMAAVLYQELFFRSRRQSLLLIMLAPAVGVFINVVRVITIVLNPLAEIAGVHTLQGLAMISAGVLVLAGIDRLLSLGLAPKRRPTPTPSGRPTSLLRWGTLASILVVFAGASLAIPPWEFERVSMRSLSRVPIEIFGTRAKSLTIEKTYLGSTGYSEWVHRRYGAENDGVYLL
ncbi:MAG: exosortase/archaeosortase family protein, partial [Myxococcota bacterium]